MEIETLNALHSLAGTLTFKEGAGGLPIALITTPDATAAISPYGAHLLSCTFGSDELLFLSQKAIFQEGTPIRGGVPICWPWFGPDPQQRGRSDHGLARTRMWNVASSALTRDGGCILTFELTDTPEMYALWPHHFRLTLTLTVGKTLTMELTTENRGDTPMELTQALHTYFSVGDIAQTHIAGLDGTAYLDKIDNGNTKIQNGAIRIEGEIDRIYPFKGVDIELHDDSLKRIVRVGCEGSKSAVVWNPWVRVCEQKADLSDNDYTKMVCIETTNAGDDIITLQPAQRHTLKALYALQR